MMAEGAAAPPGMVRRRRVLVVSTGRDRGALAVARALWRAGWVVGTGTPNGTGMVAASRGVAHRHVVSKPRGDGTAFVNGVNAAARATGYDLVFGGGDDYMAALATYSRHLELPVGHPPSVVVRRALDKVCLGEYARRAGLLTPHTVVATPEALDAWSGPVVVKCRAHWFDGQTHLHRIDARYFPNAAAARDRVRLIRASNAEPLLQEPVTGTLAALVGVFDGGRLHGGVQQVSPRLWPTPNGMSARARTVPVEAALAGRVEELLCLIGWRGLVELQFLIGADGNATVIDLNGRPYGSLALAEAARPGLIEAWARMGLGEGVVGVDSGRPGLRYSWLAGDLRRARIERRRGLLADVTESLAWAIGASTASGRRGTPSRPGGWSQTVADSVCSSAVSVVPTTSRRSPIWRPPAGQLRGRVDL